MTSATTFKRFLALMLIPVWILGLSVLEMGCGGDEEEEAQPDPAVTETPGEARAPEGAVPPTAPPSVAMGDVVPETLSVLQFMPAGAQAALALPPVPGIIEDLVPILRVFHSEESVQMALSDAFRDIGEDLGIEADSFESLAAALGVDPASPVAVFADFTAMAISAAEAAAAEEAAAAPSLDEDGAAPDVPEGITTDLQGMEYLEAAEEPVWAVVLAVTDPGLAIAALERIAGENEEIQAATPGSEEVDGVTLTTRGDYGYFTADRYLAFGKLALLRGVAERVKTPATLRYGTVECPATESGEIVTLVYGERFLPIAREVVPIIGAASPESMAAATAQLEMYEKAFEGGKEDPMVGTMARTGDRIEMLWRFDSATHPGAQELIGPAAPLRLARYLPESTQALLSIRVNEAYKKQITDSMALAGATASDPNMAMQMQMATQFLSQLGDELSIGIAAGQGLPEIYVMLGLTQPESTQGVLQMFLPMSPVGDTAEAVINQIDTPIGMPVFLSFQSDHAIASNSEAGMRAVINRFKAGETSGFFAAMEPPFDIEVPRYQAAIIQSEILATVMGAAAIFTPGVPRPSEFEAVSTAFREFRASQELDGTWLTGRMTLYLGDLDRAAALRESAEVMEEGVQDGLPLEAPETAGAAEAL